MVETSNVFKDILSHQKVRGKPILMLCNKADVNEARGKKCCNEYEHLRTT